MTNYSYDDISAFPGDFFLTNDNKVEYTTAKGIDTFTTKVSLFEFRDTGFVKTYEYTNTPFPELFLLEVGGQKFGMQINNYTNWSVCIKNFSGSAFTDYFCYSNKIQTLWPYHIASSWVGSNLQNFIVLFQTDQSVFSSNVGIIHWNGTKPSKELALYPYISSGFYDGYVLFGTGNHDYLVLSPNLLGSNYTLYIGSKK